jgi:hypothetical protein
MANLTSGAAAPFSAIQVAAINLVDAVDDIESRLLAFEAVEQLISPQKAGSSEDLAHVDRASLGWLLTILNVEMRQQITSVSIKARTAADMLHGRTPATLQGETA